MRFIDKLARLLDPTRGPHSPSPHGCTHGYWIPCSQCSPKIRAKYNRNPEWFPVEIRDENGRVIGVDRYEPAIALGPDETRQAYEEAEARKLRTEYR